MESFSFSHEFNNVSFLIEFKDNYLWITEKKHWLQFRMPIDTHPGLKIQNGTGSPSISLNFFIEKLFELSKRTLNPIITLEISVGDRSTILNLNMIIGDVLGSQTITTYHYTGLFAIDMLSLATRIDHFAHKNDEMTKQIDSQQKSIDELKKMLGVTPTICSIEPTKTETKTTTIASANSPEKFIYIHKHNTQTFEFDVFSSAIGITEKEKYIPFDYSSINNKMVHTKGTNTTELTLVTFINNLYKLSIGELNPLIKFDFILSSEDTIYPKMQVLMIVNDVFGIADNINEYSYTWSGELTKEVLSKRMTNYANNATKLEQQMNQQRIEIDELKSAIEKSSGKDKDK